MSSYFDLVITCDLREDTPEEAIEGLKCLTNSNYMLTTHPQLIHPQLGNIWDMFSNKHFLAPNPGHEILSQFGRRNRPNSRQLYRYSLQYSGRNLHDDFFGEHHQIFILWLEIFCYEQYFGYLMETTGWPKPEFLKADSSAPHQYITD